MLIIRNSIVKKIINSLMRTKLFYNNFAILLWGNDYIVTRTKPVDKLSKTEITEKNILTLKFGYHSSSKVLKEYIAEIERQDYSLQKIYLNIWRTEEKVELIKKAEFELTETTNNEVKKLLDKKVFNEKYGNKYSYLISLYMTRDIIKAKASDRNYAEVTLKYLLEPIGRNHTMRHKTKFNITKEEARKLSFAVSYWNIEKE